jgi:hypothetical protein
MIPKRPLTPKQWGAQRERARKSTGPWSWAGKQRSSLNALKDGVHARSVWASMRALDEDPREFVSLLDALVESFRPTNAAQTLLVEDLALLRWKKRRNQRGQDGLLRQNLEKLELERLRRNLELEQEGCEAPHAEVLAKGLVRVPDSSAKFKQLLHHLDLLRQQAEDGDFSDDSQPLLVAVYGQDPTMRGTAVFNNVQELAKYEGQFVQGIAAGLAAERDEGRPTGAGDGAPPASQEEIMVEALLLDLRRALLEESCAATERYQLYLREQVEMTPWLRQACLAPGQLEWRMLLRHENAIERQIERKTRLLMEMQRKERERAASRDEGFAEKDCFFKNEPQKSLKTLGEEGRQKKRTRESRSSAQQAKVPSPHRKIGSAGRRAKGRKGNSAFVASTLKAGARRQRAGGRSRQEARAKPRSLSHG